MYNYHKPYGDDILTNIIINELLKSIFNRLSVKLTSKLNLFICYEKNRKYYEESLKKALNYKNSLMRTNEINHSAFEFLIKSKTLKEFYTKLNINSQEEYTSSLKKIYIILLFEIHYYGISFPKEDIYELSKYLFKLWSNKNYNELDILIPDYNYNNREDVYQEFLNLYNNEKGQYTLIISIPQNGETYLSYNTSKSIRININSFDICPHIIKMGFDYEIEKQGEKGYLRIYAFNKKTKEYYAEFSSMTFMFSKLDKNSEVIWTL